MIRTTTVITELIMNSSMDSSMELIMEPSREPVTVATRGRVVGERNTSSPGGRN